MNFEGAMSEMETFSQNQLENPAYSDNDQNKAKFLANREEMTQACTNFNESHMSLIQNKEFACLICLYNLSSKRLVLLFGRAATVGYTFITFIYLYIP